MSKKEKSPKKKSHGMKSYFSTLLLANYEQQMYGETPANYTSFSLGDLRSKMNQTSKNKLREPNSVKKNSSFMNEQTNVNNMSEDDKDTNSENEMPVNSLYERNCKEIYLNVEPLIDELYEEVLHNVLNTSKNNHAEEDVPEINQESMIDFVKGAFRISEEKHVQLLEQMKSEKPTEILVDTKSDSSDLNDLEEVDQNEILDQVSNKFCLLNGPLDYCKALQSHENLLKILLRHELETSQIPEFYWSGKFSWLSSSIIALHSNNSYLTEVDVAFLQWSTFAMINAQYPFNAKVFENILKTIVEKFPDEDGKDSVNGTIAWNSAKSLLPVCFAKLPSSFRSRGENRIEEESTRKNYDRLKTKNFNLLNMFWESALLIKDSFLSFVFNLPQYNNDVDIYAENLEKLFEIMQQLDNIEQPKGFNPKAFIIHEIVKQKIPGGIREMLHKNIKIRKLRSKNNEKRLIHLIEVMQFTNNRYQMMTNKYGNIFDKFTGCSYAKLTYNTFDVELTNVIKPIAIEICETEDGNIDTFSQPNAPDVAIKLFELFVQLKIFADKGSELFENSHFLINDYCAWFAAGVDKCCTASVFNSQSKIEKSIEMDNLKTIDSNSKHSSSAADALAILYSVKEFWENVTWPYSNKIVNIIQFVSGDICRISRLYFERMVETILKNIDLENNLGLFQVPNGVCIVISDINFISKNIQKLTGEPVTNQNHDPEKVTAILVNTLKYAEVKKSEVIEMSLQKMIPSIRKLMIEGADKTIPKFLIGERLVIYIESSLNNLQEDLIERDFKNAKKVLWNLILSVMSDLIQDSLEAQQAPVVYSNLRTMLHELNELFHCEFETKLIEKKKQIDHLLECYGFNTNKLIHQYYKDRYEMQQEKSQSPFHPNGVLTIICYFHNENLILHVLNARNLIPLDNCKKCDSYVKINLIPEERFSNIRSLKTKVQLDTHFPLYDEKFEIKLTPEQQHLNEALIVFTIKDKNLFFNSHCIAEAFMSFKDISDFSGEAKLMKQIHLTLTRLVSDEIDSLEALRRRSELGDKAAKEFLSQIKSKHIYSPAKSKNPVTEL